MDVSNRKKWKQFRSLSLHGLFRLLWMKFRGKDILIGGSCHGCGTCCNKINLKTGSGWARSEKQFQEVCERYPEYKRLEIVGRDEQGFLQFSCSWVTGEGLCKDYENRLEICKNFPAKSLHFCGGGLPEKCGYSIHTVTPFSTILSKQIQISEEKNTHP